jgi:ribosomal-protein-alanine N-acetyltransferase
MHADPAGPSGAVEVGTWVLLRHPAEADADEFLGMVAASRDLHDSWVHPPASRGQFTAYLARSRRRNAASFLVCRRSDGAIAGVYNLVEISRLTRTAYCSYYAHVAFAGRGLMTEGLQLLLRHAFGALGLQVVGAAIQPGNEASIRLVERAGFRREAAPPRYLRLAGVWRSHPTWSITAERWRYLSSAEGA